MLSQSNGGGGQIQSGLESVVAVSDGNIKMTGCDR